MEEIIEVKKKENNFEFKRYYRCCRNCKYYVRVHESRKSDIRTRGFSFCNQELCEFGLFISSSVSSDCDKFDFDEINIRRTELEDDYQEQRNDYADKYAQQLSKSLKKGLPKKSKFNFMHWMFADMEFRGEGIRDYDLKHINEYLKLCKDCDINQKQYRELLDGIREYIKKFLVVAKERYKRDNK